MKSKSIISFFAIFTAFLILFTFSVSADSADIGYEGELDIETGGAKDDPESEGQFITLGGRNVFDIHNSTYVFYVNDQTVRTSMPERAVSNTSIQIDIPQGLPASIYCNGVKLPDNTSELTAIGKYKIAFNESEEDSLEFTIVGENTGILNEYIMPSGFGITECLRDGEPVETAQNRVELIEEGNYAITYKAYNADISYTLRMNIDHTPPVLKLEAVKNGAASGPVDISDLEKGASISIQLNGEPIKYARQLTTSGVYIIKVTDRAGNSTQYDFRIKVYININGVVFILIIVLLIAALVAYVVISRKKLRIR